MALKTFLVVASAIALGVGSFALIAPAALLETKGVVSAVAEIWVRQVGVFLLAASFLAFSIRNLGKSRIMAAVLYANAIIQFGLFPIEIVAYLSGPVTLLSGIIPNSVIHLLLGLGFTYHALQCRPAGDA